MLKTIKTETPKNRILGKYDFYKVRIWISKDNFYIYSRFIIARILSETGIKKNDSFRIAHNLKKILVKKKKFDITQKELEELLFPIVTDKKFGYGKTKISRFKMMLRFHQSCVPIMILLFGTGCVGKSTIAIQLSERINISAVTQTNLVFDLHNSSLNIFLSKCKGPKQSADKFIFAWHKWYGDDEKGKKQYLEEYTRQASIVRESLKGDIKKCFENGKSIIFEGTHLEPSLFNKVISMYQMSKENPKKSGVIVPFFLRNKKNHEFFVERYCVVEKLKIGMEKYSTNLKVLESYFDSIIEKKITYDMVIVDVDLLNMKKTLKEMQSEILRRINEVSSCF